MPRRSTKQTESLDSILKKHIKDENDLSEVYRILYGGEVARYDMRWFILSHQDDLQLSKTPNLDIEHYRVPAEREELRKPRLIRVGLIQNKIVEPTSAPVAKQLSALHKRIGEILDKAGAANVKIACLQEAWTMPFALWTRERQPWIEFAEPADGPTSKFLSSYAKKYNMVIVSPILERDEDHLDTIWNTAVVIDHHGQIMGKARKNHVPRVGDFHESTYYTESTLGHPVFGTEFGRIGVSLGYDRHHPLNWQAYKLNGAEIVFNPSAAIDSLSETMWPIEARCAAIANSYFTCAINRVGTEEFTKRDTKKAVGHFFGSSYLAAPNGLRTPGLSRTDDGLLVAEIDLNLCRQAGDKLGFQTTARLDVYAELLAEYNKTGFKPHLIASKPPTDQSHPDEGLSPSLKKRKSR